MGTSYGEGGMGSADRDEVKFTNAGVVWAMFGDDIMCVCDAGRVKMGRE